ncbi:MAG: hypothetical protein HQL12_01905 [Candidatus Omnitrophica bacterium]|nr:hypothetical protein [Candidatus Omnitrophota bacterium]
MMEHQDKIKIAQEVLRLRLSQILVNDRYKKGDFKVPIHLALGHEAIAVAVSAIMEGKDQLVLTHRNIHYNLARAGSLKGELDEYYLKPQGLARGLLGSMNLDNDNRGVVYSSSILGNNLPVAAGLSLGNKVKSQESIVIVVTGDGAIEEGSFYESLVFLKSNGLSELIIIENNQWSLATRIEERRCPIDLAKFADSLGVRYEIFSSNNPFEYISKLADYRQWSLSNKAPVCVEVQLTTLGHWRMKTDGYPEGKFINYHAGPAPDVDSQKDYIFTSTKEDVVFVLREHFKKEEIEAMADRILSQLQKEIA